MLSPVRSEISCSGLKPPFRLLPYRLFIRYFLRFPVSPAYLFTFCPTKKATFRLLVRWSGVPGSWANYCSHIAHRLCVTDVFGLYALGINLLDYISPSVNFPILYNSTQCRLRYSTFCRECLNAIVKSFCVVLNVKNRNWLFSGLR